MKTTRNLNVMLNASLYADASKHTFYNLFEILSSKNVGCYCCGKIYNAHVIDPKLHCCFAIDLYEHYETTVYCPYCYNNTVIGDASGFRITPEFIWYMNTCEFQQD